MSTASRFRVFISAVSSEFETARGEIASDLRSRGIEVKFQEDFRQEADADTTLWKLHKYIRGCSAVVCVIGRRSGSVPPPAAAEPFQHHLPDILKPPSYTQWELLFAQHFRKRLSIYVADLEYEPDRPEPGDADDPELQARFVHYLFEELGLDRTSFSTTDQLCRRVLREDWPQVREHRPILLPYASLGELFKGRERVLEELHQSVNGDGRATAIVGKVIHGLGGVGKTRLAVEYAWRHVDDYSAIFLVSAETPEILRQNLADLTGGEVLNLPEQESPDESARVVASLRWLNENPDWLLILDNLDTPEAAAAGENILAKLRGGHVLFTGRLSQWGGGIATMELDVLERDAAARFILERTEGRRGETETDEADAIELAGELDGLALALEQAGAYVSHRHLALADYLELWRSHLLDVKGWHDPRIMKYPRSVAVTWETTLAQLDAGATALLRLLSWFAPEPLPLFVLEGEAAGVVWQEAAELVCTEESILDHPEGDVFDALSTLADFSMAVWDAELQTVAVHRVVQEIMRSRVQDSSRTDWLQLSLAMLDAALVGDPQDVRTWPSWDPLRPHIVVMAALADDAGIAPLTARLIGELGVLLLQKAVHGDAELLLRRALEIDEASRGPDHPAIATRLNNLAQVLHTTNRMQEAEPLLRRALEIDEASYGPDHPAVALHLSNLARLLQDTNRLAEAEPLVRRALEINEASYGPDHPDVALCLGNLAGLLQGTNRLEEAEPLLRRALEIDEASYGPDHPMVAIRLNNLAALLQETSRLEEAEPLIRRALEIDEASYGPDHPLVAIRLNNLARLLQDTNRLEEAEPLLRRALEIAEASYGPEHPRFAICLNNLAGLLVGSYRMQEAEPLLRRALEIDEASYGPDHPDVAIRLNNLAGLLQETSRLEEAEPLSRRQAKILLAFQQRTGHEHPHTNDSLVSYARLLHEMGRTGNEIRARIEALRAEVS